MLALKESVKEWHLKGRVLVVDDDELMEKWVVRKLSNCGIESVGVTLVSEALSELSSKRYHAVVSDIYLGEGWRDGLTFIDECSKLDIPVIAITAKADLKIAKSCLNSGVSHFLEKPFEFDELIQSLSEIWENPRCLSTIAERYFEAHDLTETEKKISRLCLKGLSNREIAAVSGNTEKTVKFHLTVIYDKCDVGSRGEFFSSILPT